MKRIRVAVIGFGRLGRACAEAILASEDLELAGIARRPEHALSPLPETLGDTPVRAHWTEIPRIDLALICLPPDLIVPTAHEFLQHRKPIVECAALEGDALQRHVARLNQIAVRQHTPAIVSAGWDPGALPILRDLFQLLIPKGHTETSNRPGVSLHHSAWIRELTGVKDALCTELRSAAGGLQRYVYVELERGADPDRVADLVRGDPQFLDTETIVLHVDSVAALEDEGHGIVMERRGTAGRTGHQLFLLEARFDRWSLAAQMMVAAARAVPGRRPGAYSLLDIPLAAMADMELAAARKTAV
jgi:diaminopimelate dehydrogenase